MHPLSNYELAQARAADLHRQAQRDALARAARRARSARIHQPGPPAPATVIRRLLAALGAHASAGPTPRGQMPSAHITGGLS